MLFRMNPLTCTICQQRFNSRGQKQYHVREIHSSTASILGESYTKLLAGDWLCHKCDHVFRRFITLDKHVRTHHLTLEENSPSADSISQTSSESHVLQST